MSSPAGRFGGASLSSGGPPQTFLQQLLEEIDRDRPAPSRSRVGSLSSHAGSTKSRHYNTPSLWVGGSSVAEDARKKLRALDEARQRRRTSVGLEHMSAGVEPSDQPAHSRGCFEASTAFNTVRPNAGWAAFNEMQFGATTTTKPTSNNPSPTSESSPKLMQTKRGREWSGSSSPEAMLKRLRAVSPHSRLSSRQSSRRSSRQHSLSDGSDAIMRGVGPVVTSSPRPRQSSCAGKISPTISAAFAEQSTIRRVSSHRLDTDFLVSNLPSTPRRSFSPMDGADSPAGTPAWMKPFHLVDEEKSIYMNVHGEDWRDHPLCLDCFRLHGNFHRMTPDGCEECGQDEILKGHYWELPDRE